MLVNLINIDNLMNNDKPKPEEIRKFGHWLQRFPRIVEEVMNSEDILAAVPELIDGLRHQIYRNHAYTETCDACRKSIAALHKAEEAAY